MDALALPTVTIPRAAHAAGFTVRGLRTLLAPPHPFPLLGQPNRAAGAWNKVSACDVVRLAVARRLLHAGLTIDQAQDVLDRSLDRHLHGIATCGVEIPASFLLTRLTGLSVYVAVTTESGLEASCGPLARPHDATLILDAGAIARAALNRLATLGTSS